MQADQDFEAWVQDESSCGFQPGSAPALLAFAADAGSFAALGG